jgi:hypothetical protein
MALHRDIYWVGKQWTVTGYGIQACDQKQKSKFDIEASRLWEDGALESIRAVKWLNSDDFDKALSVARRHFPEPPHKKVPPQARAVAAKSVLREESVLPQQRVVGKIETVVKEASSNASAVEELKPAPQKFNMRIESWPAKFVPQWRVRIGR